MKDVRRLPAPDLSYITVPVKSLVLTLRHSECSLGSGRLPTEEQRLRLNCGHLVPALTPEFYAQAGILYQHRDNHWHTGGIRIITLIIVIRRFSPGWNVRVDKSDCGRETELV